MMLLYSGSPTFPIYVGCDNTASSSKGDAPDDMCVLDMRHSSQLRQTTSVHPAM